MNVSPVMKAVTPQPDMKVAKWAYFCYFAAMAGFMPFLTLYNGGLRLSAGEIGLLVGVTPVATFILPISLLHGLTFSAMWSAAVAYAGELAAPKGLMTTAQGLLSG